MIRRISEINQARWSMKSVRSCRKARVWFPTGVNLTGRRDGAGPSCWKYVGVEKC